MNTQALKGSPGVILVLAIAVEAGSQQFFGLPQTKEPLRLSPAEIEIYKSAKPLTDWTPHEIESLPFLHKLHPAENKDELPTILDRVGKTAMALYRDFPNIACDEEVYSETNLRDALAPEQKAGSNAVIYHFRYIVIPKMVGDQLAFDEYRTHTDGKPIDATSLPNLKMITSNFTSSWTYFSPSEQADSRFRLLGTQTVQKRECYVVGFAQNPEKARSVSGFRVGDRAVAIVVQGIAWIDTQSFEIRKIETSPLAPRPDIGLNGQHTLVSYSPVQPTGFDRALWLPRDVTVTILYRGAYFRNTHHYSKFKLFRVESTIKPVE